MESPAMRKAVNLALRAFEVVGYLAAVLPLYLYWHARQSPNATFLVFLACVTAFFGTLAAAFLIRRSRRQHERIDGLRKTLNEAIVHDLKNPMTSIMGSLSCVLESKELASTDEKLLALALQSCRNQMTLLESLIDTNRLESGELLTKLRPVRTRDLIETCLEEARGLAARLDIELRTSDLEEPLEDLRCDPDLLSRTLLNLLHNAIKYARPKGWAALRTRVQNEAVVFEVTDNGIGIPAAAISRLFEKYYRVEGPEQGARRGSGLGLYFCRLVAEAHGGGIRIESDIDPGGGTTVSLLIPHKSARTRNRGFN
jgi:signal transduction histidine kinase